MKTIIILVVTLSFLLKIAVHIHLDLRNKRFEGFTGGFMPLPYFFFYVSDVNKQFETERKFCNFLFALFLASTVFMFIYRFFTGT